MKRMTFKVTFLAIIMGISMGAMAADKEIILHEAIHDYSDDAYRSYADPANVPHDNAYRVNIVLDEALHDYVSEDIADFKESDASTEHTELAALGESIVVPWEIVPLD